MDSILSLEQIIQVIHAFLVSSGCHDAFMTGTLRTVIRTTMKVCSAPTFSPCWKLSFRSESGDRRVRIDTL